MDDEHVDLGAEAAETLHVAGIGASAGGLAALRSLFEPLPADLGVAWVVVVHLSPEHESHLASLLQPHTRMPVRVVDGTDRIEPNTVHLIPPNAKLSAIDTHLRVSPLEARFGERDTIDHFLRTLAGMHDGRSIGIVLTGHGSDGSLGLRLVREHGGLTIAQDPAEAEVASMPRSAIEHGAVDLVLPIAGVGAAVRRFAHTHPVLTQPELDAILCEVGRAIRRSPAALRPLAARPRVLRRMRLHGVATAEAYLDVLRADDAEAHALYEDLLLTVAEFFEPRTLFEDLARAVVPRLVAGKAAAERVRVWSIGCATGEGAYSLAILLLEELVRRQVPVVPQVFASDLPPVALARARAGIYPAEIAAHVSPERLERYFDRVDGYFRVSSAVRDLVVFARQSAVADPPFPNLDLIVCCDLLRSLPPQERRDVLDRFAYALRPGGVLVLGPDDALDDEAPFVRDPGGAGFHVLRDGVRRSLPPLVAAGPEQAPPAPGAPAALLHDHLRGWFAPPSVLVDADGRVLHYSHGTGRFIQMPGGVPTHAIDRLVRAPLRAAVREGLEQTTQGDRTWRSAPVTCETAGGPLPVAVRVAPAATGERVPVRLVTFEAQEPEPSGADVLPHAAGPDRRRKPPGADDAAGARADDELHAVQEELRASREELQSSIEELAAIDSEHVRKIARLRQLSGDLRALLESTGVATLVLDREIRIARFTPRITELFRMREADVGRPLSDLTHTLRGARLEADARRVLREEAPLDRELQTEDGRWFLARVLPYRGVGGTVEGVAMTFMDITERRRMEDDLRDSDRRKDEFLATLAHELRNPLAPIMSGIDLLRAAGPDAATTRHVMTMMERQAHLLVRLVDDLLDVARVSGGRLRLRTAPIELADVVRDAVALVQSRIDERAHQLLIMLPETPLPVHADEARLIQVVANLLANAAEYTPPGGRLTVRADRHGETAVVAVQDNGIGLTAAMQDRIFDLFVRGEGLPGRGVAGLGVGLTLARSLTEMHGGTLTVESAGPGTGSTFTMTLPLGAAREADVHEQAEAPATAGRRVLIVDDNVDAAEMLEMLVETIGVGEVRTASSGAEALDMAPGLRPDVVLLDLSMPGMDGYEVARRIRRESWGRDVHLVALTGWGQDEHRRRTREAGFDVHLSKPADRATLEAVLAGPPPTRDPT